MKHGPMIGIVCALAAIVAAYAPICRAIPPSTSYQVARGDDPVIWTFQSQVQAQGLISQHIDAPKVM